MSAPKPFVIDMHSHILPRDLPNIKELYGYSGFIQLEHHCPVCRTASRSHCITTTTRRAKRA